MLEFLIFFILIHLVFYKPSNNLSCGLFGYAGSKPADIDKLKVLGILNEERGSHSAGIYIGDTVVKGLGKFTKLIQTNNLYDEVFEPSTGKLYDVDLTVIGHTRSPSYGTTTTAESAHPFEIYTEEDAKETKPTLVGAHNGTIKNWKALCEEFKVDHTKIGVDSQGLLSIIAKREFDVLNKYDGGAALLWTYPHHRNTLFVFKGASKTYSNGPYYEDRPLYYWKTKQNGKDAIYISSIQDSLLCIGGTKETIFSFESNVIYMIVQGVIMKHKFEVKRDITFNTFTTTKTYTPSNTAPKNYHKNINDNYINDYSLSKVAGSNDSKVIPLNPLFKQIPFLTAYSANYKDGVKKIYNINKDIIVKEFNNSLGGRIYYGKDSKMYRNGHTVGSFLEKDINVLNTYREQKRIKDFTNYILGVSVKHKLDRHGFAKNSNYSLYRLNDDYVEYFFIDGYMVDASDENKIEAIIQWYYDNTGDLESLAAIICQPIIVENEDKVFKVLFNPEYIIKINHYSFGSLIPFANCRAYFEIFNSQIEKLNVCKQAHSIHLDYNYSAVCIDNTSFKTILVEEYGNSKKEGKIIKLDSFNLKDNVKTYNSTSVIELPETITIQGETDNYEDDLPFKVKDKEVDVDSQYLEGSILISNLKVDIEVLERYYDEAIDINNDISALLNKLEAETSINTIEATKALNSFAADIKLLSSATEDYVEDFATSFYNVEKILKEKQSIIDHEYDTYQ